VNETLSNTIFLVLFLSNSALIYLAENRFSIFFIRTPIFSYMNMIGATAVTEPDGKAEQ
jgi:hypothetical protein